MTVKCIFRDPFNPVSESLDGLLPLSLPHPGRQDFRKGGAELDKANQIRLALVCVWLAPEDGGTSPYAGASKPWLHGRLEYRQDRKMIEQEFLQAEAVLNIE